MNRLQRSGRVPALANLRISANSAAKEFEEASTEPPSAASSLGASDDWESNSDSSERQGKQVAQDPDEKILFDAFTIRTWFIEIDLDQDGKLSRDELVNFLTRNPTLQRILLKKLKNSKREMWGGEGEQRIARAVLQRHLFKLFKEMDLNKSKLLEFEEFLWFFRHAGLLLEYVSKDNPRDRAAELLASVESHKAKASVHLARRRSEHSWSVEQRALLNRQFQVPDHTGPRGHSDSSVLQGPAAFWKEPLVLQGRKTPRSRSICEPDTPEGEPAAQDVDLCVQGFSVELFAKVLAKKIVEAASKPAPVDSATSATQAELLRTSSHPISSGADLLSMPQGKTEASPSGTERSKMSSLLMH